MNALADIILIGPSGYGVVLLIVVGLLLAVLAFAPCEPGRMIMVIVAAILWLLLLLSHL